MAKKTTSENVNEAASDEKNDQPQFSFEKVKDFVDEFTGMTPVLGINAVDKVITLRYGHHLNLADIRKVIEEAQQVFGINYQGWKISLTVLDKKYMTLL